MHQRFGTGFGTLVLVPTLLAPSMLAPCLAAQDTGTDLIGITREDSSVVREPFDDPRGSPRFFLPARFEKHDLAFGGGTAYDGRRRGVWISQGRKLACIDIWNSPGRYLRRPRPVPAPPKSSQAYITGLACVEAGAERDASEPPPPGWLFASYSSQHIGRIRTGRRLDVDWIQLDLPRGETISGLATDDVRQDLYVLICKRNGEGYVRVLDFADESNWGRAKHSMPLPSAQPMATRQARLHKPCGLAFEAGAQLLYVSDGSYTIRYSLVEEEQQGPPMLRPRAVHRHQDDAFTGMSLLPRTGIISRLRPCHQPPCHKCKRMRAVLHGDPVLGNPTFGLGLRYAPSNATSALLMLGDGSCSFPGVDLALCRRPIVYPAPPHAVLFNLNPVGGKCRRNLQHRWPIPRDVELHGRRVSVQWMVSCQPTHGATGNALSNCLSFTFSG